MTLKETAIAAAQAAGDVQKAHFGTLLRVDKAARHDVKLEADRLCEQAIVETIRRHRPGHAILTEEAGEIGGDADLYWIIDPLDGTVNFSCGLPYFCTSVACYRRPRAAAAQAPCPRPLASLGEPMVGVVYAPPTDELFVGEIGRGATRNGTPIQAAGAGDLSEGVVAIGFGGEPASGGAFGERSGRRAPHVRKLRCLGAAAYDLCNVACGRLVGFYEVGLRSWDIAAAHVILLEAGAELDILEYEPSFWDGVAACPGLCQPLRDLAGRQ